MESMTVASQKDRLLEAYSRFVILFLQDAVPATNDCFPSCPDALRTSDRTAAIAMLHQSTSTGRASITKDSLFRKAKKGVKTLLRYMGDWVRICKDPATREGAFVPSEPQSGQDRDWAWNKVKSTEHRANQCLKIWKARSENRHLAENTDEAVREALVHLNFARRGYSLEEELQCRSKHESENLGEAEGIVYDQIMEEVDSGQVVVESDDENPTQSRAASNTTSAPRGYHEQPYCEMQGRYHPFELAAKAFTQYAGHGHEDISAFYTSEWAELRRTQHESGAHGRHQQRRQTAASRSASLTQSQSQSQQPDTTPSQSAALTAGSLSSATATQIEALTNQMERSNSITQNQMERSNSITHHNRIATSLEKAIEVAIKLKKHSDVVSGLQERYFDFLLADINLHLPAQSAANGHGSQSNFDASDESDGASQPPVQRRRVDRVTATTEGTAAIPATHTTAFTQATQLLAAFGHVVDNNGGGNCLFHCFEMIEEEFLELCRRRPRQRTTYTELRAQVVSTLRADSAVVQVAAMRDVLQGETSFNILYAEGDMRQQKTTVDLYCDWQARDGSPGRSVRLFCFCLAHVTCH